VHYLYAYWRRYRKLAFAALLFLSLETFCDLLQPAIASKIIDEGVKTNSLEIVFRFSSVMLAATLAGACGAVGRNILASVVSQSFARDLRMDLFEKIASFSFEELGKNSVAGLITRMTNDTTQLQNFSNGMMRIFIKAPLLCLGSLLMVLMLNFRLAIILLVTTPIIALLMQLSMKIGFPYFTKMQERLDQSNSVIREFLSGVRVVKSFSAQDREISRFGKANEDLAAVSAKAGRVMAVFTPIISFAVNMSIVVVLWIARPMIAEGNLQIGQLVAFINYMTQILVSLGMIFNVYQQFIRAKASAERIGEVFDSKSEAPGEGGGSNIHLEGFVEFRNVTFSYPNSSGQPALKNLSFSLEKGETLGVIGSTGSGKSTLISLIPGFYLPSGGSVLLDGVSTESWQKKRLREDISLVAQTALLFTGTIKENILWGKEGASDAEVSAAASAAQALEFISAMPDGFGSRIGQNGVNLSGGQKQRLSIARAVIRKPKILLLDDCVSAVDAETEAALLKAVGRLSENMTCIMVSQRVSSVMRLKKILVLDDGEAAGLGSHEELLKSCSVYREICRSQLAGVI
jgi:ATP-binding cassette subfamily B protein